MSFSTELFKKYVGFFPSAIKHVKNELKPNAQLHQIFGYEQPPNPQPKTRNEILEENRLVFKHSKGVYKTPNPVLVSVATSKNVIVTDVAGSNIPPVIEIIGLGSSTITIAGYYSNDHKIDYHYNKGGIREVENALNVVVDEGQNFLRQKLFPYDELRKMHDLFMINESLKVTHATLQAYGIDRIVMTDFEEINADSFGFGFTMQAVQDSYEETNLDGQTNQLDFFDLNVPN